MGNGGTLAPRSGDRQGWLGGRFPAFPLHALAVVAALAAPMAGCAPVVRSPGIAAGEPTMTDDAIVASDDTLLPLRRWLPEGPVRAVVLALHGFNDYANAFDAPARYWAQRGIATYAYDQRGFGAAPAPGYWHGTQALVADAREAATLLRARHPGVPLVLLGESMGGAVALLALAEDGPPVADRVVLSAPAVWGWRTMPFSYRAMLWLSAHLLPGMKLTGEGLDVQASDNIPMLIALGRDPLVIKETRIDAVYGLVDLMDAADGAAGLPRGDVPLLVLCGERDEIVPVDATRSFLRKLKGPYRVAAYANGYHMLLRDLQAVVVYEDVLAWLDDATASLPSGADGSPAAALLAGGESEPGNP